METSKEKIHDILLGLLVSFDESYARDRLYFRKPTKRLIYPCIIYDYSGSNVKYADGKKYINHDMFKLTVIDTDPCSKIADAVRELDYCTAGTTYQTDGLNHFVFKIYV